MTKENTRILIIVIVVILIIVIVVGILNGWFRNTEKLSPSELDELNKINRSSETDDNANEIFSKLWKEHVDRTRQYILASFRNEPDRQGKEQSLLDNQKEMADAVDKYYPGSSNLIHNLLKDHIVIAKNIVEDLKYKRLTRVPADINKWYSNADKFGEAMHKLNPNWNLTPHMHKHLMLLENEVIAEWIGLKNSSAHIYDKHVVPQAQQMANHISQGLNKINLSETEKDTIFHLADVNGIGTGILDVNNPKSEGILVHMRKLNPTTENRIKQILGTRPYTISYGEITAL